MPEEVLLPVTNPQTVAELNVLARRYRNASGPVVQMLGLIGGSAEAALARLPAPVRSRMDSATHAALSSALSMATKSRHIVSDRPDWVNRSVATLMGATGGFGGIAGSIAELPFTVTVLLRSIQRIAASYGFDPEDDEIRMECLRIFASSGPVGNSETTDMGFFTTKLTVTGAGLSAMIAKVVPRFSAVLGQKMAAQTAPVLGAVAGATINYGFTRYYQEVAHVHFALKRLALTSGEDEGLLREELVERVKRR